MANIEHLTTEIEKLSSIERQEMAKKLLEKMNNDEIMQLLEKLKDNMELFGSLKITETVFEDWENEEDSIYDHL
jgi:ribosomal protein L9